MTGGGSRRRTGCRQRRGEEGWLEKKRGGAKWSSSQNKEHPAALRPSLPPSGQGHPPFSPSSTTGPTNTHILAQKGKHLRATRKQVVFYSFLSLLRGEITTQGTAVLVTAARFGQFPREHKGQEGWALTFHSLHHLGPPAPPPAAGLPRALPSP